MKNAIHLLLAACFLLNNLAPLAAIRITPPATIQPVTDQQETPPVQTEPAQTLEDNNPTPEVTPPAPIEPEETSLTEAAPLPAADRPTWGEMLSDGLSLSTDPPYIKPDQNLSLFWKIDSFEQWIEHDVELQFLLPPGLSPVTPPDDQLDSKLLKIKPEKPEGEIALRVEPPLVDLYPIEAVLYLKGEPFLKNSLILAQPVTIQADRAGTAISANGNVSISFAEETLAEEINVVILPLTDRKKALTGANQTAFEVLAFDSAGQEVRKFEKPVKIEVTYPEELFAGNEIATFLYYFDEEKLEWIDLPGRADPATNTLTAYSDHFTLMNLNTETWQSPMMARPENFQVAEFTGAGTYSFPIDLPPGPGGFQPSLSLSYNSQIVDSANIYTQANWAGMGWSLDTPYIFRNMNGTASETNDDTFNLVIDGTNHRLLKGTDDLYHTENEIFWRIQIKGESPYEKWWEVKDKEGNIYIFGQENLHFSGAFSNRYISHYLRECNQSGGIFEIYRWSLQKITNKFGKDIVYTYTEDRKQTDRNCDNYADEYFDRAVYPETITYPNNRYRILFEFSNDRNDYRPWWDGLGRDFFYDRGRLSTLKIQHDADGDGNFSNAKTVYQYAFYYTRDNLQGLNNTPLFPNYTWDAGGKTLTLNGLQKVAFDNNNNPIYQPVMKFHYDDQMHLTRVENGYGGVYQFSYQPWSTHQEVYENYNPHDNPNYPDLWKHYLGESSEGLIFVNGEAYLYLKYPHVAYQNNYLGSFYELRVEYSVPYENTTVTAKLAIDDGLGNLFKPDGTPGYYQEDIIRQTAPVYKILNQKFILPATSNPTNTNFRLLCKYGNTQCGRDKLQFRRLPTYYRVSARTFTDQITGKTYTYTYGYSGASMNNEIGDGEFNYVKSKFYDDPFTVFRGHQIVTVTDPNQKVTTTTYGQLKRGQATYTQLYLTGKPVQVTITDGIISKVQAETVYGYTYTEYMPAYPFNGTNTVDTRIRWVRMSSEENRIYQSDGSTWTGNRKYYFYDSRWQDYTQYGNLTQIVESAKNGSTWQDYRLHFWAFKPVNTVVNGNNTKYLVSFPRYHNVYTCPPGATNGSCYTEGQGSPQATDLLSSSLYIYDDNTDHNPSPSVGKLTGNRTLLFWQGSTAYYGDIQYGYDAWGNQTQVKVYPNYTTLANYGSGGTAAITTACYGTYSAEEGLPTCENDGYYTFKIWEWNPFGHQTQWGYDKNLARVTSEIDPNGALSTATYDPFGRMTALVLPGDSTTYPTLTYQYCDGCQPFRFTTTQRIEAGNDTLVHKNRHYYDGLGRLIQSHLANATLGMPNGSGVEQRDVVVDYEYDALGQVIRQTVPYDTDTNSQNGGPYKGQSLNSQPVTLTNYDVLGRPLQMVRTDGVIETQYEYNGLVTTIRDAKNQATIQTADVWGRVIEVKPPAGPKTGYEYDRLDRLTTARQQERTNSTTFATTTITYDSGGRKTAMSDPDMGDWSYAYDPRGNLTRQTDARNQTICLFYDPLDRLKGKTYRSDMNCPTSDPGYNTYTIKYYYDQNPEYYHSLGRRTQMVINGSDDTTWAYDARGRLVYELKIVTGAGSFKTEWVYNSANLVKQIKYPSGNGGAVGETVTYTYNSQLAINSVNGTTAYVPETRYDAAGRIVQRSLGGSVAMPVIRLQYEFFDWRLPDSSGECPAAGLCGRLKSMIAGTTADATSLLSLQYFYDLAGNITSIEDYKEGNPQTQTFTYDSINRLTSAQASGGTVGNYGTEYYRYDDTNGNLIHKAASGLVYGSQGNCSTVSQPLTHAAVRAGPNTYCYDQNGNQTKRSIAGPNLLSNPGVEASGNWEEVATSTYPATSYHRSTGYTSSPNSGTYAYALSNHAFGYLQSDFIPVSQAVEYDLYVWMRGEIDPEDSYGRWRVRAYFYDANNNLISGQNYAEVANGGEGSINLTWQLKGGRFTTPVSTAKVRIRLENGRNSGWIAFDDVVLNPVGGGNIAPNNGFESSGSWTEIRETKFPGTSFYRSNWGTAAGRNNSYAYVISNHAYGYLHNTTLISITANTQYDLYASVRGEIDPDDSESGGWIIRAYFYDSAGNPLSYINASSGGPGSLTTSWQNKGGRFTTPANAAKLQIQLYLYMSTGWVAYDNVDLKKVGTSTNLVTNPGFEDAAGWSEWRSSYYPGTSFLRATSGTAAPLSGLYAYAISNHSQGNLQSDSVSVAPNSDYDLYAFIRGELDPDDSHGAWRLRVNYYDSAGTYLTYQDAASGNPGGLTAAWQYLGGRITTPANAASLKVRLYSYQTSGWIAIDDVSLTQKVSDAQTTNLTYDAENRLVEVKPGSSTTIAAFTYDGDGNRVKGVVDSITTVYIGNYFEWTGSTTTMKKYYYAGGQRVAVRTGSSTLNWLLGDHLGSAMVQTDANGGNPQVNLYKAWGEPRPTGSLPSPFGFTGQRSEPTLGLYFYNARWYDPYLNRFLSPDSIIPDTYNPIDWDRYNYVRNNPVKYIDSDGHFPVLPILAIIGGFILFSQVPSDQFQSDPSKHGDPVVMALGLMLMTAPAFGPGLCLNDGNCTNEIQAASNLGQQVSKDGNPFNEIETAASTGKTLLEMVSKIDARTALKSGIEGLTNNQTQKAIEILGKGKVDSVTISILENGSSQIATQVLGGDGGSFVRYVYTIDPSGKTIGLMQYAFNKVGELIHVHDKFTNTIIK